MRRVRKDKIAKFVKAEKPIHFRIENLTKETKRDHILLLSAILEIMQKKAFIFPIRFCFREIFTNAIKANLKRAFFFDKGLNINDPIQYKKGMQDFKKVITKELDKYYKLHNELHLYIRGSYLVKKNILFITLANNTPINDAEKGRILKRIEAAQKFDSMAEAFSLIGDETEGAGLGIVMLIITLKNLGLADSISIKTNDIGETIALLKIDFNKAEQFQEKEIAQAIVDEIENIPHYPENIMRLQSMLNDPDVKFPDVSAIISRDPSLTADLLKYVNSPLFMLPNKVTSIKDSVPLIGLKGLRNILFSYGTENTLAQKYKKMDDLWQHAYKTAYIAHELAISKKFDQELIDNIFITGLLHDMGKIILFTLHPGLLEKLKLIAERLGTDTKFFESSVAGIDHGKIGGLIAEKWNFPQPIIKGITFHHDPEQVRDDDLPLVYTVTLADEMAHVGKEAKDFFDINGNVLMFFGITAEEEYIILKEKYNQRYEKFGK